MFFMYQGGVLKKCILGQGLITSGDIYKFPFQHICIKINKNIKNYIVPIPSGSPPPPLPLDKLLIWVCKSATITFNA